MEGEARNLQNDFFNDARKSKAHVTVFLANGRKIAGRIKSFDKYTVLLENHHGELMIFKHAISTVSTGRAAAEGGADPDRRPAPSGPRPLGRREG
jgi:host factor-I protein